MDYPSPWLVATFVFAVTFYFMQRRKRNFPPGPYGLPLVGYVPFVGDNPPHKYMELSKKYGPILSVSIGSKPWVVLNDYDSVYEALVKHSDAFSGRPHLHVMHKLTQGFGIIFRSNDPGYTEQRKFALTTLRGFGLGKKSMEENISEEAEYLTELIESKNGKAFNCQLDLKQHTGLYIKKDNGGEIEILAYATSNVICRVTMGSRFSYDDKTFQNMISNLTQGFCDKSEAALQTFVTLGDNLRYIPPYSSTYKQFFKEATHNIDKMQIIIEEHRKSFDENNIRDYIDQFLKEMKEKDNTNNSSFHDVQLLQSIRDFFLAGTETTSSTLRWCVLYFALFPETQGRIFDEIKNVIGQGVPSMKNKADMPFTSSFMQEMLRYWPVTPLAVPHSITCDVTIRGLDIPKGTPVLVNLYAVHHDPKYFENPEVFKPDRFIDGDGKFIPDSHVIPFSVGPRFCLGEQLAKMEFFLFLTNLVQRFEIVGDPEKPLPSFHESISGLVEVPLAFVASFKSRR